ncbi:MAG TPA: YfhO family protein [Flavisolibacter sp.]|nr:YfhO family protein [Flavisolibacter sp.]
MKGLFSKLLPHLIAVIVFLVVAVIYCKPVLQGYVLNQSDVTQWKGMSKDAFDYKEAHGHFPLWINNMFSGMPAYQVAMESGNAVSPGIFYYVLTLGLPKPISFFFLACICFYFLTQALRLNPYLGIIGGLAYAYVTYNTGIIEAGHDTKMQSIALVPAFIGSLILLYDKKYLWGLALTGLFTSLLIAMNHMQIVYYALITALFMTAGYLVHWVKSKQIKHALVAGALALIAGALGVLTNAITIFTTLEASKTTIRGGTEMPDKNATATGLSKDYALSYSMYKTEPFVMMVPNIYGGSGTPIEQKLEEAKSLEVLQSMPQEVGNFLGQFRLAYWGGIGSIPPNAPAYIGSIICFLALIGFFILDNKHKWWILAVSVLSFLMSWGQYFEGFNTFLLNVLPGYNKFRVPSMIILIPTLLFCMMAMLTLQKIISMDNKAELWERYKKGLMLTGGVFVVLLLIYFGADFTAQTDKEAIQQTVNTPEEVKEYVRNFFSALKDDRRSLFMGSLLRSFLFIAAAAFVLWLSIRKNTGKAIVLGLIGVLAFIDVMSVDVKYLNEESYQEEAEYNQAYFTPSPVDQQIMQDTSYYRVFDLRQGLGTLTGGAVPTAYFHNSIGGYHPAKLSIYQDLIEHQLFKFPQSLPVVNMLNTKYIIQTDQSGNASVYPNGEALGHAWFVNAVRYEKDAPAVMNALTGFSPRDTAVLFEADRQLVSFTPSADSSAFIRFVPNGDDHDVLTYRYSAATNRFAVFSEIFYKEGWKAYVDGKELPIVRTNYVLRGLSLPAGQNKEIRFEFRPSSYYSGKTISLVAGLLVLLLMAAAAVQTVRAKKEKAKA